jgi:hypothetical protein
VEDDLLPWSDFIFQFLGSDFLENQFIKLLGPSLGVNGMWTKRNDHAPKSECVGFSNICLERVVLKKKTSSLTILLYPLAFVFYS